MDIERKCWNRQTAIGNDKKLSSGRTMDLGEMQELPGIESNVKPSRADALELDSGVRPNPESSSHQEYHQEIQDCRMTIGYFVETKFVPEHVMYKSRAGRTHYQAILKHILKPECVDRIFITRNRSKPRLISVPNWPYLDDVRLCDFNANHVRGILSAACSRNYSWQTVKHIKNVIGAIIAHAKQEGCFDSRNPATQVTMAPKPCKSEENLTIWQAQIVLSLLRHPEREIASLTICTGMSATEACNLRWKHVNLSDSPRHENGEIIPPKSIAVGAQLNLTEVKAYARSRRRDVPIGVPLFSILSKMRAATKHSHPNDFVFATPAGRALEPLRIRAALRPIARKLGIPWLRWQALRKVRVMARSAAWGDLNRGNSITDLKIPYFSWLLDECPEAVSLPKPSASGLPNSASHSCAGSRFR